MRPLKNCETQGDHGKSVEVRDGNASRHIYAARAQQRLGLGTNRP